MKLDIHSAVVTICLILGVGAFFLLWNGIRSIRVGRKSSFFRIRAQRMGAGWRMVVIAVVFLGLVFALFTRGERTVYQYFPPSPTLTRTPTITLTPTISLTPSITPTPTITLTPRFTYTPTEYPTPFIPLDVATLFTSLVTPFSGVVFSPLEFSQHMENALAVDPSDSFTNPVGHLYAVFSYDQMVPGAQWTAIWYHADTVVYYETKPWDGTTGGYGFTDWEPQPSGWLAGDYRVAIFVGMEFVVSGSFTVIGDPPTAQPTATRTVTITPTRTTLPSITPTVSKTPLPTDTRWPTPTP